MILKLLDFILYRARFAAVIAPVVSICFYALLFWISDTLRVDILPSYMDTRDQLLGLLIVLLLIPAFLLTFVITAQRRSMRFAQELVANGVTQEDPNQWLRPIRPFGLFAGAALGVLYGLFMNTPMASVTGFFQLGAATQSIVIGQTILWALVGFTLSVRLQTAFAFNRIGKPVRANILDTSLYGPFARSGVDDVLSVAILLVLSTAQALDAQFRIGNYVAALFIAVPAAAFLFLLPMLSIHRRLRDSRKAHLERINLQIESAPRPSNPAEIQTLESLLQHRDRIRETFLWPINRSVTSQLAVYIIIPPIAWFGAAVVEFGVERILSAP